MRLITRVKLITLVLAIPILSSLSVSAQWALLTILCKDQIEELNVDIRNDMYGKVSSLLIYEGTRLQYERYYGFSQASTLHPISSVTKSITSIAVGIAIEKGYIPSLDVKVYEYFPEHELFFDEEPAKRDITLRHLLSQTVGFKWDEWTIHYSYAGNPLIELSQKSQNWIPLILGLPLDTLPGKKFTYNSACSEIIKEIVSRSSEQSFREFVETNIFNPLSITSYHWDTYPPNGEPAWGGLSLTTRDMAKIGVLMLNNGFWTNRSIVTEEWVKQSTKPLVDADSLSYGLHWWVGKQPDGKPMFFAAGYGDQYIYIAPDKNLVVAFNAKNFTDHKWERDHNDLIERVFKAYIK